jgi:pilus assembly protein Flp/PilA
MTEYQNLVAWLQARCSHSERGANLVEYALLLALVAIVCISAVTLLGTATSRPFSQMSADLGS